MVNIITKTNEQFGTIRQINGKPALWCGSDVAKALGYANSRKAITDHCRCVTKRYIPHPQSPNKQIEVSFIPEADVYRLICHSKLPKAQEFEKWVFEDVVPNAVRGTVPKQPTQKKLYDYRDKTFRGTPVMSVQDVEHFTNLDRYRIQRYIKQAGTGQDFILITGVDLAAFKYENSMPSSTANHMYLVTKSGFDKICAAYGLKPKMPELFTSAVPSAPQLRLAHAPSESMRSLIGYIQRETDAIQAASKMLLTDDTKESLEVYRSALVRHIISLRGYCYDVKTIRI